MPPAGPFSRPSRPTSSWPGEPPPETSSRFALWRLAEAAVSLLWWAAHVLRLHRLYVWWMGLSPPLMFVVSFAVLIAAGTAGLVWVPGLTTGPLAPLDALFTITSAVSSPG